MTSLSILDSEAGPQQASPLFTRLPTELRLMIYSFVFVGCQATVWFDGEFGEYLPSWYRRDPWQGRRRSRIARDGQCCYGHGGGGFGLLMTCRMVYIEAFQVYWSETALRVTNHIRFWRGPYGGCELQKVCDRLPAPIKANLRYLSNTKLPRLDKDTTPDDDTNWTPSLLGHFPKLETCAFLGGPPLAKGQQPPYILGIPDSQNMASFYRGLGPFHLEHGESCAAFLERIFGIQRSCNVTFLSTMRGVTPRDAPRNYEERYRYFNYTTGMVYQTTIRPPYEDGFEEIIRAKKCLGWSHCVYYDDDRKKILSVRTRPSGHS